MRTDSLEDPWMSPSRQGDHPSRAALPEQLLHRRREGVFLVLASLFMVAIAMLQLDTSSFVIDLSQTLSALIPSFAPPTALALLFGAIAFPISFIAINLVCELYGKRRARALIVVGLIVSLGLVGVMQLGGQVSLASALALVGCFVVAHVVNLVVFDGLRRSMRGRAAWLRQLISTMLAQVAGWGTFVLVSRAYTGTDSIPLAAGSALYVAAFAAAIVIPFAILTSALNLYLRVDVVGEDDDDELADEGHRFWVDTAPRRRLPAALIVDDEPPPPVRSPFTSMEMRFFTEGDQLAEPTQQH